jgi:hypothetical protein
MEDSKSRSMVVLFWVAIGFTATMPTIIGLLGGPANVVWASLVCGAFITFISKADGLAELSLGPLKAKMKETIQEASATVGQLRELATTMASAMLTDIMAGEFLSSMPLAKRLQLHDALLAQLDALGLSPEQRRRAEAEWVKGVGLIYNRIIRDHLRDAAQRQVAPGHVEGCMRRLSEIQNFSTWLVPGPEELKRFCKIERIESDAVMKWIDDYDHFSRTNEIRHREEFEKQ